MTELPASTLAIMERVREETGKPVSVSTDAKIEVGHARAKVARESMPSHLVQIGANRAKHAGYLVAHECGHILRVFATPPAKRKVPMVTAENRRIAIVQMQDEIVRLGRTLPERTLVQMLSLWHQGIVSQITSLPADIMIERWIYHEYPDLRPIQRNGLDIVHHESVAALKGDVARISPRKIYGASMALNHAFFASIDVELGTSYSKPFASTPHKADGERLRAIIQGRTWETLAEDCEISDQWAKALGFEGWFQWTGFEDVPPGYLSS